jgi:hypothetical protein
MNGMKIDKQVLKRSISCTLYLVYALLVLASCTTVGDGIEPLGIHSGNTRRIYVNDLATNSELNQFIVQTGVQFVAQPQGEYSLFIGNMPPESELHARFASNTSVVPNFSPMLGVDTTYMGEEGRIYHMKGLDVNSGEVILLALRQSKQRLLQSTNITKVRLLGKGSYAGDKLGLHFVYYGSYDRFLPEHLDDSLAVWTPFLHDSLKTLFTSWGITLDTVSSSKLGDLVPTTVTLPQEDYNISTGNPTAFDPLDISTSSSPSTFLHVVFVNKIVQDPSVETIDTLPVLGYSIRAGTRFGPGTDQYVVVSLDSALDVQQTSIPLVVAHEVNRFLSLRPTTVTTSQRGKEGDFSNVDDGITDNDCGNTNSKRSNVSWWHGNTQGLPDCELAQRNLMYPSYTGKEQNQLTTQQLNQVQQFLSLIPH